MTENQEIKNDLKRILFYLDNDSRTGKKGLVTEVEDVKKEVNALKNTMTTFIAEYRQEKAVQKAKIGIIGAIGGAIVTGVWWLITHIFR